MPEGSLIEPTARTRPMSLYPAKPNQSDAKPAPCHSHGQPIDAARRGWLLHLATALLCGASQQASAATSGHDTSGDDTPGHDTSADDRLVLRAGWVLRACDC